MLRNLNVCAVQGQIGLMKIGLGTSRRIAADFICTASSDDHTCNRFLCATTWKRGL